jgi:PAS domain S-box-containing protein
MDFVHPDDQEVMERFHQDLPKAEFDEAQYRIISGSKQVKWVRHQGYVVYSDQGTIRRMDHVIRDITEEKKVLEALTRSEARYREFFESTNDMAYVVRPDGVLIDLNNAGLKLLGFESKKEAFSSNLSEFYVDISEQAELLAEISEEGYVEGKRVKLKNRAGEVIEVAVTARAKTDDSGYLLYYDGIATNITKALEDQSNRVLRNAAGGLCHYLNSHLMQLDNSEELTADDMKSLDGLIEKLVQGENIQDIAIQMKEVMKSMHYFHKGIRSAYKRISEVTKAFNQAFQYTEESYVTSTILDIFKTYGYDPEDPAR